MYYVYFIIISREVQWVRVTYVLLVIGCDPEPDTIYFHLLVNFNHTNMKLINLCIVTTLMAVVAGQQQCQHALKAVGTLCTGNGNVCDIYQQSRCDSAMKDVLALKNYPVCSAAVSQCEIVMHTCNGHVPTGD